MSPDKMVHMANQIAAFFRSQPGEDRIDRIAQHLSDYWAPAMREELVRYVAAGGAGLAPEVVEAAGRLKEARALS